MPNLTLYHFDSCPYCNKVRQYLSKRQISIPMKDTHASDEYRDELIKLGGKKQVPALAIDDTILYESDDIIEWFEEHRKSL